MKAAPMMGRRRSPQGDAKVDAVLRLLRGEPLHNLAEELDVPPQRLLTWRDAFLAAGQDRLRQLQDGKQAHYLSPMRPERPEETHAALKTTTKVHRDLQLTMRLRTVRQLRQRSTPNPGRRPG